MLAELHVGHPGVSRTKALARGEVWWQFGWYGGRCGEELFKMSASTTITNISTDATMELANHTLVC